MSEYIRNTIIDFFNNSVIVLTDDVIEHIEKEVEEGVYAFQIIYSADESSGSLMMNFELAKPLDYKLVKVEYDQAGESKYFSYDGGKTYKYNEYETLLFDLSIIREEKLKKIIG
jgi:hypothetical protein